MENTEKNAARNPTFPPTNSAQCEINVDLLGVLATRNLLKSAETAAAVRPVKTQFGVNITVSL